MRLLLRKRFLIPLLARPIFRDASARCHHVVHGTNQSELAAETRAVLRGLVGKGTDRSDSRRNTALAHWSTPCLGTFDGQQPLAVAVAHRRSREKSSRRSKVLCSLSSSTSRCAGERRRHDGAGHPQLLLARRRSSIGSRASCGRYTRVCDRDSRRHQDLVLVSHCPLTTWTLT